MAADYLTSRLNESHPAEGVWSPWRFWDRNDTKGESDRNGNHSLQKSKFEDVLDEVHFTSTRMTDFLLDTPTGDFSSSYSLTATESMPTWSSEEGDDRLGDLTSALAEGLQIRRPRASSMSSFDSYESLNSMDSDINLSPSPPLPSASSPNEVGPWAHAQAKGNNFEWPVNVHAVPFIPKNAAQRVLQSSSGSFSSRIWGPPMPTGAYSAAQEHAANSYKYGMQLQNSPAALFAKNQAAMMARVPRMPMKPNVFPVNNRRRNSKGNGRRDSVPIETFDIENGLCIPELASMPFINGRKVVRFFSKRTSRRTIVSIIEPSYLLPGEDVQEGEIGFLTFHDCVELRTLKTGETLTRNQRNNLRKRLATTARTIVQVDVPQLLADFSDPDCCPRSTYHHTKLNAYLVTPAVGQVLLCTRETDLPGEPYKGQSLAVQTLFDLCKNENAGAALKEFIKSQPGLDLDVRDFKGMCPIHYAAKGGFKDIIQTLLDLGVDVNVKDKSDQSPLHYAIYNGHQEVQFQLLEAGAYVDTRNVSGNTLLHVAAYHNQTDVAAAILRRCPELRDVRNHKFNSTPLECAMHKGLTDMVKLLATAV